MSKEELIGLIPAAGKGVRLGLPYPKELYPVIRENRYKPISQFVLNNLTRAQVRHVAIVINEFGVVLSSEGFTSYLQLVTETTPDTFTGFNMRGLSNAWICGTRAKTNGKNGLSTASIRSLRKPTLPECSHHRGPLRPTYVPRPDAPCSSAPDVAVGKR